ncbi:MULTISPECIES: DUF421 domain-containing protein [Bacillaceae]|uniref:DUF421 domain-containing protein n=1 Tax=Bacillaceae TaxID=186817 RepID=UPI000BFCE9B2|nr:MULTISPECIES: DUF421 domain-containing protein [Bacillaceae]PGT78947.1 DUF421 domain-containing protein [Bacillus sp. AFS040349]UGB29078.1 DUF421 domain-containing protein [Metabacillus sp. B2-18]
MDLDLIWKSVIIVIGGTILLRIAGRKSISQMTLAQVVIMIGIGSLLVQPLVGKNVWTTLVVGLTLVLTLVVVEFTQIKSDKLEKFISGKAKILIKDGKLQEGQLKKLRLSVDLLEMKLRQSNVNKMEDIKYATLEPNGQIGFELKENKKPATKEDINMILQEIQQIKQSMGVIPLDLNMQQNQPSTQNTTLFTEITKGKHSPTPPSHLQ